MSLLTDNTTALERFVGCGWANDFSDSTDATPTGSPTFGSSGVTLNGTTDYVDYTLAGTEFGGPATTILVEFSPSFAGNDGLNHALVVGNNSSNEYLIGKTATNTIRVDMGNTTVFNVAYASWSAQWNIGSTNQLIVSSYSGVSVLWLNGTFIALSASGWAPTAGVTELRIGSTAIGVSWFFGGTISLVKIFGSYLTAADVDHYYSGAAIDWESAVELYYPMRVDDNAAGARGTFNRGSGGATFNGTALSPRKIPQTTGYTFDGSDKITISHDASWSPSTGLTVLSFVAISTKGANRTIVSKRSGFNNGFWLIYNNGTSRFELIVDTGGAYTAPTTTDPNIGQVYCVCGLYDGHSATAYIDGSFAGADNASGSCANAIDTFIGEKDGANNWDGNIYTIGLADSDIGTLAVAKFYQDVLPLLDLVYPSKPYHYGTRRLGIDPSLAVSGSWIMAVTAGSVVDLGPNINNGLVQGAGLAKSTLLGPCIGFNGIDTNVTIPEDVTLRYSTGSITIEAWVRFDSITGFTGFISKGSGPSDQNYYLRNDDGKLEFYFRDIGDTTNVQYETTSDPFVVGQVYHVVFTHTFVDSASTKMFINGELEAGSWVSGTGNEMVLVSTVDDVDIGSRGGTLHFFNGDIYYVSLFPSIVDQDWVDMRYALGASAVQFGTDWGVTESLANETTGYLGEGSSPFEIDSGTWKISTDTINGQLCKVIECVVAGVCYVPASLFRATPTEAAYGSWRWWQYKDASSYARVGFASASALPITDGSYNGYTWEVNAPLQNTYIRKRTAGASTNIVSGSPMTAATWTQVDITRAYDGEFSGYMDGASIGSAATETTYTDAYYFVLDFDAGDKIAYADIQGDHSIVKYLGVNAP